MNRLNAGLVLLIGLLVAPLATEAQQSGRVYRVGYLSTPTRESVEHGLAAFLRTLRELGWIEGQNLIIEYRWAEGNVERLPALAAELVRRKVDVIVAPAGSAALAAKIFDLIWFSSSISFSASGGGCTNLGETVSDPVR